MRYPVSPQPYVVQPTTINTIWGRPMPQVRQPVYPTASPWAAYYQPVTYPMATPLRPSPGYRNIPHFEPGYPLQPIIQQKPIKPVSLPQPSRNTPVTRPTPKDCLNNTKAETEGLKPHQRYDILRHSSLRYMGYANELAESWEDILKDKRFLGPAKGHQLFKFAYGISQVYTVMDILHQGLRAYRHTKDESRQEQAAHIATETIGAGIFQIFAGYLLPAKIVRYLRLGIKHVIERPELTGKWLPKNSLLRLWLPALISSAVIPFMVRPIDKMVGKAMSKFYWRPVNAWKKQMAAEIDQTPV